MNCAEVVQRLEDYLDRTLPLPKAESLERHLALCENCRGALADELAFREALRNLLVPAPAAGYARRMLAAARGAQVKSARRNFVLGLASAAAFAALAWFVVTPIRDGAKPTPGQPEVRLAVGEVKSVHLVFHVARHIDRSTMSLELPEHVELRGYPGKRSLTWQTALHSGANDLALPILGRQPASGELKIRITYGEKQQEFNVRLSVAPDASMVDPARSKGVITDS